MISLWIHAQTGSTGCIEIALPERMRIKAILEASQDREIEVTK